MTVAATTAVTSLVLGVVGEAFDDAGRFCVCAMVLSTVGEAVGGAFRVCVCTLVPGMVGEVTGDACRVCACTLLGRAGLTVVTELVEDHRGEVTSIE